MFAAQGPVPRAFRLQAQRRQHPSVDMDEVDHNAESEDGLKEPSYSYLDPSHTEQTVELSYAPDEHTVTCFVSRSSNLEKKYNSLIHAVDYHLSNKLKSILRSGMFLFLFSCCCHSCCCCCCCSCCRRSCCSFRGSFALH